MGKVILICGRIAGGKSVYARRLCEGGRAVALSIDEVMLAVFGQHAGDMHDVYASRIEGYLLGKAEELARAGVDVALDWGPWTRAGRAALRERFASRGIPFETHCVCVDDKTWRARLEGRNRAVTDGRENAYYVDENIMQKFLARYEEPGEEEIDVWVCS